MRREMLASLAAEAEARAAQTTDRRVRTNLLDLAAEWRARAVAATSIPAAQGRGGLAVPSRR